MKSLGSKASGARLERMRASPLWAGDRFRNLHPIIAGLRDPNVPLPTLTDFLCGGVRRVPRGPLPAENPLASWAKPAGSGLRYVCVIAFVDPASGEELTVSRSNRKRCVKADSGTGLS